jgi:putative peptide zinc metalloprotease protein
VVSQEEASRLFAAEIRGAQVKLHGQANNSLAVTEQQIIPAEQHRLPSAALGWSGGGEVAVTHDDSGVKARESFFEVRAAVEPGNQAVLIHGLSGAVRFNLPPEPLGAQWVRKVRQLLQKRFGV